MNSEDKLIDYIPEFGLYMGVSSFKDFHVLIKLAEEKNFHQTAEWLRNVQSRLNHFIDTEYHPSTTPIGTIDTSNEVMDSFTRYDTEWGVPPDPIYCGHRFIWMMVDGKKVCNECGSYV